MSFERLAPHYRWMERVLAGHVLQRCRVRWLTSLPVPRRVLLAGEGPGRFLEVAARAWPEARFCCLDASGAMLARARVFGATLGDRVEWLQATLPDWSSPTASFDLVVTHFFLDCFPPDHLKRVIRRLAEAAAPEAHWLLADFRVAERGWRRVRCRVILGLAYAAFRLITRLPARRLTLPDPMMRERGFHLHRRELLSQGLLHTDWWRREGLPEAGD